MAETAGLALGVVALFSAVKEGLQLLSRARNFRKNAGKLQVKLLLEEVRLLQWGHSWGYPSGDMDVNLRSFSPRLHEAVIATLKEIVVTLGDVEILRNKYGLEQSGEQDSTSVPLSMLSITDGAEIPPLANASRSSTGLTTLLDMPLLKRSSWALDGSSKLEALAKDMKDWNDALDNFQPQSKTASLALALEAAVTKILEHQNAQDVIDASVDSGLEPLHQTVVLGCYAQELEKNAFEHTKPLRSKVKELLLSKDGLVLEKDNENRVIETNTIDSNTKELRQFGTYQFQEELYNSTNKVAVMIEWKFIAKDAKPQHQFISRERVLNIACLLHTSTKRPAGLAVLPCLGVLLGDIGAYGLVFEIPWTNPESNPESTNNIASRICSLHDILRSVSPTSRGIFEPNLSSRFSLALRLAISFLHFHSASWLHKRFSSHNVLLEDPNLTPSHARTANLLCQAYITGFGYSRPTDDGFGSISLDAIDQSFRASSSKKFKDAILPILYTHPKSTDRSYGSFCQEFDIYALGLVLLEIGLWTSLESLLPSPAQFQDSLKILGANNEGMGSLEIVHQWIFKRYVGRLNVAVGDKFENVVRWCLMGQFETDSEVERAQEMTLGEKFYWNVIAVLQKCSV